MDGGINTYAYVEGNPLLQSDFYGLRAGVTKPFWRLLFPWLFPAPYTPKDNYNIDPTVPWDPTDPLPNTPHDDSDSDDEVNCPPFIKQEEDPLDKEKACLAAKKSVLNTCAGLTGAKMMRCYNAAENTYRSCMGYPPLR